MSKEHPQVGLEIPEDALECVKQGILVRIANLASRENQNETLLGNELAITEKQLVIWLKLPTIPMKEMNYLAALRLGNGDSTFLNPYKIDESNQGLIGEAIEQLKEDGALVESDVQSGSPGAGTRYTITAKGAQSIGYDVLESAINEGCSNKTYRDRLKEHVLEALDNDAAKRYSFRDVKTAIGSVIGTDSPAAKMILEALLKPTRTV